MRSSDVDDRVRPRAAGSLAALALFAIACSPPPPTAQSSSGASAPDCAPPPPQATAVAEIRRSIEGGPLYAVASRSGLAGCHSTAEDGAITLEYTFRDGASMHVTRSQETEYTDQEIRLASPLTESAVAVLTRAEQAAFDAKGCGIDWRKVQTAQPGDEPGATESIYRGNVCNCQARARADATGRVLRLQLRSAC
jgi:hypothetical protein